MDRYRAVFANLGYTELTEPWTFRNTHITMHCFGKQSSEHDADLIVIDLLLGHQDKHAEIIAQSVLDESPAETVRLATREDLIWMKQMRGSKTDQADIEQLEANDESD